LLKKNKIGPEESKSESQRREVLEERTTHTTHNSLSSTFCPNKVWDGVEISAHAKVIPPIEHFPCCKRQAHTTHVHINTQTAKSNTTTHPHSDNAQTTADKKLPLRMDWTVSCPDSRIRDQMLRMSLKENEEMRRREKTMRSRKEEMMREEMMNSKMAQPSSSCIS
jgi:hypothetical protein